MPGAQKWLFRGSTSRGSSVLYFWNQESKENGGSFSAKWNSDFFIFLPPPTIYHGFYKCPSKILEGSASNLPGFWRVPLLPLGPDPNLPIYHGFDKGPLLKFERLPAQNLPGFWRVPLFPLGPDPNLPIYHDASPKQPVFCRVIILSFGPWRVHFWPLCPRPNLPFCHCPYKGPPEIWEVCAPFLSGSRPNYSYFFRDFTKYI